MNEHYHWKDRGVTIVLLVAIILGFVYFNGRIDEVKDELPQATAEIIFPLVDPLDEFMGETRLALEELIVEGNEVICVKRGSLLEEGVRCLTMEGELRVWVCKPPFSGNLGHCVEKPKDEVTDQLPLPPIEDKGDIIDASHQPSAEPAEGFALLYSSITSM